MYTNYSPAVRAGPPAGFIRKIGIDSFFFDGQEIVD
jgi:hypothetical protein